MDKKIQSELITMATIVICCLTIYSIVAIITDSDLVDAMQTCNKAQLIDGSWSMPPTSDVFACRTQVLEFYQSKPAGRD